MTKEREVADAHWEYIQSLLEIHELPEHEIALCRFHYITAFTHGWKHCMEWTEEK